MAEIVANNLKIARQLIRMTQSGETITLNAVAEAAGVHPQVPGEFMRMWTAMGWLTKQRVGRRLLVFSVTDKGWRELNKLIERYG